MFLRGTWAGLFSGLIIITSSAWANTLENIRVWPAPDETRIVMDMTSEPAYSYLTLSNPNRLVIDLKKTTLGMTLPKNIKNSEILTKIRKSTPPQKGVYRLVFELKNKAIPRIFKLTPSGEYGHRVVIDLPHEPVIKKNKPALVNKDIPAASLPFGSDDIIIAIDPGHGGNDPGAIGPKRKYEKYITLAIARRLADKINATKGMKAELTRNGDYFVDLNKRSSIARKKGAHLLVSIHADGFHTTQPRGASVWVLSRRRANSEIGRWIEKHEEQSNLLGGGALLNNNEDEYLSRAVLDLQFSNSQKEGYDVAVRVLKEMGRVTKLHKSSPEHASLAVLKSPDIPSLLVEAGFITNPQEEKLLNTVQHQQKIANAVYKGILDYFQDVPPIGTLFAMNKATLKHKVVSGQSLSVIAEKYAVRVSDIKSANGLKSNTISNGQILKIPNTKNQQKNNFQPLVIASTSSKNKQIKVPSSTHWHTVKHGEYLGQIAQQYDVTIASIRKANTLSSNTLFVGQKLKINNAKTIKKKHKVKRGEYLEKIANNYDVSIDSIRRINQLRSDKISVGQTLIIPGS